MSEWFFLFQQKMVVNHRLLLGMLSECDFLDIMRLFFAVFVTIWLLKTCFQAHVLFRLRRNAVRLDASEHPFIYGAFQAAGQKAGLRKLPTLYESRSRSNPAFIAGTFRPCVFVHPDLARALTRQELTAVFVHELVHIKRGDNLLISSLELFLAALPLLFIQLFAMDWACHPVNRAIIQAGTPVLVVGGYWLLHRAFRPWRELSCDDRSVAYLGESLNLAAALLKVCHYIQHRPAENQRWRYGYLHIAKGSFVEKRVKRLIDYKTPYLRRTISTVIKTAALVLILLTGLFLFRFHVTDSYQSPAMSCHVACRSF